MKEASPGLIALLSSTNQFIMADLYTITLVGGSVLRYSAAATALFANGYIQETLMGTCSFIPRLRLQR